MQTVRILNRTHVPNIRLRVSASNIAPNIICIQVYIVHVGTCLLGLNVCLIATPANAHDELDINCTACTRASANIDTPERDRQKPLPLRLRHSDVVDLRATHKWHSHWPGMLAIRWLSCWTFSHNDLPNNLSTPYWWSDRLHECEHIKFN